MTNYNIKGAFNSSEAFTSELSGHIGIINQNELQSLTKNAFGEQIPSDIFSVSKNRWRGDFRKRDCVLGLKETSRSSSSRISNAACLAGDLLSFYIELEGHGVGVFDGKTVFAKSRLEITVYDILRGKSNTCIFTDYGSSKESPKRFLVLKVPDADSDYSDQFFSDHGMCGLLLMRIREVSEFHYKADWSDEFPYDLIPKYNDSFIQIAIYPWNLSLREFDFSPTEQNVSISNLSRFIIDTIVEGDDEINVFDNKSYFPNFRRISKSQPIDLNDDEKNQTIRLNTMALISSQLPLLNASAAIAPVLGIGMAESNNSDKNEINPLFRNNQDDQYSFSKSASMFSLTGVPALISTIGGLNDFTKDNQQLSSVARNPSRVVLINPDSNQTELNFSLFGQKSSGFSVPLNIVDSESSIILNEDNKNVNVYIDIRQINSPFTSSKSSTMSDQSFSSGSSDSSKSTSENSGSSITDSSKSSSVEGDSIVISFDSEIPEDQIKSVSFSYAINNLDFKIFIDSSGLLREKIFYAEDYNISLTRNDIVYGRVGIEDENGVVSYWYSEYNIPSEYGKLSLSDFRTKIRTDGSGIVDFYYNLQDEIEITSANVELSISSNDGISWVIPSNANGDIGLVQIGQNRHISWNPSEYNSKYLNTTLIAKLKVLSLTGVTAAGRDYSGAFMVKAPKEIYISKHINGIKQSVYYNEDIKNPFIASRIHSEIIGSSSSISTESSESSESSSVS